MELERGKACAILGPNGSGKTLPSCTCCWGLPACSADVLTAEGVDYEALDIQHLRRQIGLVAQHALLRSGTIWDNLVFGNEDITAAEALNPAAFRASTTLSRCCRRATRRRVREQHPALRRAEAATGYRPSADAAACRPDLR